MLFSKSSKSAVSVYSGSLIPSIFKFTPFITRYFFNISQSSRIIMFLFFHKFIDKAVLRYFLYNLAFFKSLTFSPAIPISASLASPGPFTAHPITAILIGLSIFAARFSTSFAIEIRSS